MYSNSTLKTVATVLSAFMFAASVAGCSNRNDKLSEWSPDFTEKCSSMKKDSDLEFVRDSAADHRLQSLFGKWSKTQEGQKWSMHAVKKDIAFCFGKPVSDISPIAYDDRTNAYIIDENLGDGNIAHNILNNHVSRAYNKTVEWSERYKPQDALLWSRMKSAHKINIKISQVYKMSDYSFDSEMWQDFESDPFNTKYAKIFKESVKSGMTDSKAHTEVLRSFVFNSLERASDDRGFLKWYDKFLHTKTVPHITMCMGFDGKIKTCIGTKTVVPGKHVASAKISPEAASKITSVYMNSSYLEEEDAGKILNNPDSKKVDDSVVSEMATVKHNANKCCGDNRPSSSRSMIGISFSGSPGITFFLKDISCSFSGSNVELSHEPE